MGLSLVDGEEGQEVVHKRADGDGEEHGADADGAAEQPAGGEDG